MGDAGNGFNSVADGNGGQGSGRDHILLVDDSKDQLFLLSYAIEGMGITEGNILEAEDGAQGLAVYRELREVIALVVTDSQMPGMDGGDMIEAIREAAKDAGVEPPVMVIRTGEMDEIREQLSNIHNVPVFDKMDRDGLKKFIREKMGLDVQPSVAPDQKGP